MAKTKTRSIPNKCAGIVSAEAVIIAVVFIGIAGAGVWLFQKRNSVPAKLAPPAASSTPKPTPTPNPDKWIKYESEKEKYSVRYPQTWKRTDIPPADATNHERFALRSPDNQFAIVFDSSAVVLAGKCNCAIVAVDTHKDSGYRNLVYLYTLQYRPDTTSGQVFGHELVLHQGKKRVGEDLTMGFLPSRIADDRSAEYYRRGYKNRLRIIGGFTSNANKPSAYPVFSGGPDSYSAYESHPNVKKAKEIMKTVKFDL